MPIFSGGRGVPGILGVPALDRMQRSAFRSQHLNATSLYISGVTKDSTGTPLGNCAVALFQAGSNALVASTISDTAGNYSFAVLVAGPFFAVAYKAGSPNTAGTTVITLTGA